MLNKQHGFEVCSECKDYPCKRFDSERDGYDSFVTHKKVFQNQEWIQKIGIDKFIAEQQKRIEILNYLIGHFDNERSKSFFCQTCTLLPLDCLDKILKGSKDIDDSLDIKEQNRILRVLILEISDGLEINLKLRKK